MITVQSNYVVLNITLQHKAHLHTYLAVGLLCLASGIAICIDFA